METAGLLKFMNDLQTQEELRAQAEELLLKLQENGWSHAVFCAELLKIARENGYTVNAGEVAKLRAQKAGYVPNEEVKGQKGHCWPFDYSYYLTHKK